MNLIFSNSNVLFSEWFNKDPKEEVFHFSHGTTLLCLLFFTRNAPNYAHTPFLIAKRNFLVIFTLPTHQENRAKVRNYYTHQILHLKCIFMLTLTLHFLPRFLGYKFLLFLMCFRPCDTIQIEDVVQILKFHSIFLFYVNECNMKHTTP